MQLFDIKPFSERINKFFQGTEFARKKTDVANFTKYLYKKIQHANNGKIHLTRSFLMQHLSEFLKLSLSNVVALLRQSRIKRESVFSDYIPLAKINKRKFSPRIFFRKKESVYKITNKQNQIINNASVKKIKGAVPDTVFSESPIKQKKHTEAPCKEALSKTGKNYRLLMSSTHNDEHTDLRLWRAITPEKDGSERIQFSDELAKEAQEERKNLSSIFDYAAKKGTEESFHCSMTPPKIMAASKAKRRRAQKSVMGNVPAYDLYKAAGAIFNPEETSRDVHYCHRQAHGLGGGLNKENIDPMTKAANFQTLALKEVHQKNLLVGNKMAYKINKLEEFGSVHFDSKRGLPDKIKFFFSPADKEDGIKIVIDPLNRTLPSQEDYQVTRAFIESELNPYHL